MVWYSRLLTVVSNTATTAADAASAVGRDGLN